MPHSQDLTLGINHAMGVHVNWMLLGVAISCLSSQVLGLHLVITEVVPVSGGASGKGILVLLGI